MPESDLRISLIIPCYNEERYLPACLDTIECQTKRPFEVIVVDNASTDRTAEVASAYPSVQVVAEPKLGRAYAQAAGLNAASGNLLVRIDADTRLPADWLERLATAARERPAMAAFTASGTFYDAPWPHLCGQVQLVFYQWLQWPAMRGFTLWGAAMAIRSDAWQAVQLACHYRNDIDEDIDLTLQLKNRGYRIGLLRNCPAMMSLCRGQTDPLTTARYLASWPRDYVVNGRYVAALYITCLTGLFYLLSLTAWLVSWLHRQSWLAVKSIISSGR